MPEFIVTLVFFVSLKSNYSTAKKFDIILVDELCEGNVRMESRNANHQTVAYTLNRKVFK